jgi:O-antigen ligase
MLVPLAVALLVNSLWWPEVCTIILFSIALREVIARRATIPVGVLPYLLIFGTIVTLGMIGAINHSPYAVIKDLWYFTNPCIAFVAGYVLTRAGVRFGTILSTFMIVGCIAAIVHLGLMIFSVGIEGAKTILEIRGLAGPGYFVAVVAFAVGLVMWPARGVLPLWLRTGVLAHIAIAITFVSIVLSFSRTLWLSIVIVVVLTVIRTWRANRASLAIGALAILVVSAVAFWVSTSDTAFAEKVTDSLSELGAASFATSSDINRHWRAFESAAALDTFTSAGWIEMLVGHGFGKQIDLGITVELAGSAYDEIPILHNGYLYVLVKTGIVGLMLVVTLLYLLYRKKAVRLSFQDARTMTAQTLIRIIVLIMVAITFFVGGLFNSEFCVSAMLLLGCCFSYLNGTAAHWSHVSSMRPGDDVI